jgi:hypothetical protein
MEWRERIVELADRLFETIHMQSSVERHQAIAIDRGATLDTLDWPLNNRRWLSERLRAAQARGDEAERLAMLDEILNWKHPGPGGFYDDLGNPSAQPHLVRGLPYDQDPASLQSARTGFEEAPDVDASQAPAWPLSWIDHAESLVEAPLRMRYTQLDPSAQYRLRVVYAGDGPLKKIRLVANGEIEIHPLIAKPSPVEPIEFSIPVEATAGGQLELAWFREPGLGDNGRGCQVSEVWLIRVTRQGW